MNVGMSAVDIPTQYAEAGPVTGYDVGSAQFRAYNGDPESVESGQRDWFQNILTNRPNDVWVSQWFYIRNLSVANRQQDYQVYYRVGEIRARRSSRFLLSRGNSAGFAPNPTATLIQSLGALSMSSSSPIRPAPSPLRRRWTPPSMPMTSTSTRMAST
jgi:hypothetical protein